MNNSQKQSFRRFAKKTLKEIGKSQRALADALSVSPAYVSQILSGKKKPPDLGREGNAQVLKIWADFLKVDGRRLAELVRHDLHMAPLPPNPRYPAFRNLAISKLASQRGRLLDEIRAMTLHPAEHKLINMLTQILLMDQNGVYGYESNNLREFAELAARCSSRRDFIEIDLCEHFEKLPFKWSWDENKAQLNLKATSDEMNRALDRINRLVLDDPSGKQLQAIPVVGRVSATKGFKFSKMLAPVEAPKDRTSVPAGIDVDTASLLYCVKVQGDSLREYFGDGASIFIKANSWQDIVDGDLVIYRDKKVDEAFVMKLDICDEILVLKPLNSSFKNVVLDRSKLNLLERVVSVVF